MNKFNSLVWYAGKEHHGIGRWRTGFLFLVMWRMSSDDAYIRVIVLLMWISWFEVNLVYFMVSHPVACLISCFLKVYRLKQEKINHTLEEQENVSPNHTGEAHCWFPFKSLGCSYEQRHTMCKCHSNLLRAGWRHELKKTALRGAGHNLIISERGITSRDGCSTKTMSEVLHELPSGVCGVWQRVWNAGLGPSHEDDPHPSLAAAKVEIAAHCTGNTADHVESFIHLLKVTILAPHWFLVSTLVSCISYFLKKKLHEHSHHIIWHMDSCSKDYNTHTVFKSMHSTFH